MSGSTESMTAIQMCPEDRVLMAACVRGMQNLHARALTTTRPSQESLPMASAAERTREEGRLVWMEELRMC